MSGERSLPAFSRARREAAGWVSVLRVPENTTRSHAERGNESLGTSQFFCESANAKLIIPGGFVTIEITVRLPRPFRSRVRDADQADAILALLRTSRRHVRARAYGDAPHNAADRERSGSVAVPADVLADWRAQDGIDRDKTWKDAIAAIAGELGSDAAGLESRLRQLRDAPAEDPAWGRLYKAACLQRRAARLRTLLKKWPRIVVTKHYDIGGSHYAYTEGQSDAQNERGFAPGASLCLLSFSGLFGQVRAGQRSRRRAPRSQRLLRREESAVCLEKIAGQG